MMPTIASAKTANYLDDSASFTIAKSVKLGLGEDEMRSAPAIGGQHKVKEDKHTATKCSKNEDCEADQYCTMGMCKDLCERNRTKKKVKCSGETPVCTPDNHDSYCACTPESCNAAWECRKVSGRYSCEPCSAGEKCGCPDGKMSNGSGKCVTCNFDSDCADDEYCSNSGTEASSCSIVTCSTGEYVGNHQCNSCSSAIPGCTDCTSSSNCTSCEAKYQDPSGNGGECVMTTCSSGQYLNEDDGNCYPCSNGCRQCTSSTNCQACEDAYELVSGAYCELKGCAADQYLNMADGQCYSCPAACSSCSTVMSSEETSACTACVDDYKLSGTQCVQKSCSDMGYSTSCGEGQDSVPANKSGSDGACYTCSAIAGYCTSDSDCASNQKCVNNECVGKTCSEINSSYKTSCSDGYSSTSTGVSGSDGTCYTCSAISGYCTSDSQCGTNQKCVNNECVGKTCSEINSSYKTSCSNGYSSTSAGVSGSDGACYTCSAISGYCTSDSDCASNQKCVNNSCVLKTCAELGHKSSCNTADGYTAVNANVTGSDGTCYDCNVASCPSGYSTSTTSCSGGYALDTDGKSGGKACGKCVKTGCTSDSDCGNSQYCSNYICTTVPCDTSNGYTVSNHVCVATDCPLGYSASTTSCSGGYTLDTDGKSGGKACGKCVAANCPSGYSTSVTSCGSGYTLKTNGYSGDNACGKCEAANCPSGYSTSVTSCDSGYTLKTNGYSGDNACGKCEAANCPSGYSTSVTSCGSGYTLKTNGYSGGKACGKCEEANCPSGYSTSVTSCTGKEKLETNGSSGGKACGKCVLKTCKEMGYATSCGSEYYSQEGAYVVGSDGPCFICNMCPPGYATSTINCGPGTYLDTQGSFNGAPCGKCLSSSTCEALGYHTYGPQMVCTPPIEVTVNGLRCYKCGSSSGTSCEKKYPSPDGTYRDGADFCYFIGSAAKNAWETSKCASHLSCSSVKNGASYYVTIKDGFMIDSN